MAVYVTQENPRLNYSDAERFGTIKFLSVYDYSPNGNSKRNEKLLEGLHRDLRGFDPMRDHVLLTGDPVVIAIVFQIVAGQVLEGMCPDHGDISLLKWDGQNRKYNQIVIDLKKITIPV